MYFLLLRVTDSNSFGSSAQEKGYRDYGHDIDNTDTLVECGLSFTCDFNKSETFIGQSHVLAQKALAKAQGGLNKRLAQVILEDSQPLLHGGEVLRRNGVPMAEIRTASYGHVLGGAVGLVMLESADECISTNFIAVGDFDVMIADVLHSCRVSLTPLYDPKNLRVKA
jgi:glycine cleavage system aminomethyltransferase T